MNNPSQSATTLITDVARHFSLRQWIFQHWQACAASFNKMSQTPLATLMTLMVIGIALALPCGLFVLLQNVQQVSNGWQDGAQISLYLKKSSSEAQNRQLSGQLSLRQDIASIDYISPQQGLEDFKQYSGFDDVLAQLDENPLPAMIVIHPSERLNDPRAIENYLQQLKKLPNVDLAKLDMAWVKRLYHILALGRSIAFGLALLLGFGVILIIGNTIRLATQSYQNEIKVTKLVGGTDAFIRRPFLYSGALYGAIGGILAMLLVGLLLSWLDAPVQQLAGAYNSHFALIGLDNESILLLIACGAMLGLFGSWLAVAQHLHDVEAG